jgi:hypothetical protein
MLFKFFSRSPRAPQDQVATETSRRIVSARSSDVRANHGLDEATLSVVAGAGSCCRKGKGREGEKRRNG